MIGERPVQAQWCDVQRFDAVSCKILDRIERLERQRVEDTSRLIALEQVVACRLLAMVREGL